jgi:hypothetical protein
LSVPAKNDLWFPKNSPLLEKVGKNYSQRQLYLAYIGVRGIQGNGKLDEKSCRSQN